jgi:hypothetical protein
LTTDVVSVAPSAFLADTVNGNVPTAAVLIAAPFGTVPSQVTTLGPAQLYAARTDAFNAYGELPPGDVIVIVGAWAMAEHGKTAAPTATDKNTLHGLIMNTLCN